jgi:hypothetical protein
LAVGLCLAVLVGPAAAGGKKRSPFAGKYSGAWTFKSSNVAYADKQLGTLTLSVTPGGKVTGTLVNRTYDLKSDVKGTVSAAGELALTFELSGLSYTLKGTVKRTGRGGLKGALDQAGSKGYPVGTIELDLAGSTSRRPAAGGKPAPGLDARPAGGKERP